MTQITTDRRISSRRASRGGGRRTTDPPAVSLGVPTCQMCRKPGVALLAGESEGGWWFVCLACDHLWNERQVHDPRRGQELSA
jgi:hypothetical protein